MTSAAPLTPPSTDLPAVPSAPRPAEPIDDLAFPAEAYVRAEPIDDLAFPADWKGPKPTLDPPADPPTTVVREPDYAGARACIVALREHLNALLVEDARGALPLTRVFGHALDQIDSAIEHHRRVHSDDGAAVAPADLPPAVQQDLGLGFPDEDVHVEVTASPNPGEVIVRLTHKPTGVTRQAISTTEQRATARAVSDLVIAVRSRATGQG